MDLFAAAGLSSDDPSRGGARSASKAAPRTLRIPLFNYRVVEDARNRALFDPSPEALAAAGAYAKKARSPAFAKQKETAVRNLFFEEVLGRVLGYRSFDPDGYTLAFEWPIRRGAVDVAVGRFGGPDDLKEVVVPFEAKGPGTGDLDAIPPGGRRSPVQQAWDYAIDAPGSRWVLVSNCLELRLYGFGRGREAYELFDLTRLDEKDEHERLWIMLSAERLLGGATDALLAETDSVYKAITNDLYGQYKDLRDRLIQFLKDSPDGPKLAPQEALEQSQKTLDRILFIAFVQRIHHLPQDLFKAAVETRNPFDPQPIWTNFQGLFRYFDRGRVDLDISAYNGGLFASDPIAEATILPDELAKALAKLGEWDYRSDVPVTILGHIFEQSVTDLETLRAESLGRPPPAVGKRKREGVVYTPDTVTRFLVERTIGLTLAERFDLLLSEHAEPGATLSNGAATPWREEGSERAFWTDYAASLRSLTIVDPACGSGAFLVAAFDRLADEYRRVVDKLAALGEPVDFDAFDEIVTKNLYGVDLNAESVEITRLALWLKTARRKHRLQNLEATIKVGNSLIADAAFTDQPFDWRVAFPEVFAQGGFDIVIGNPPYVRSETIADIKPALAVEYAVYDSAAVLYCYYSERGFDILRDGGRLGFISASGFFKTSFGRGLRAYLAENCVLECGVDFGDLRVFREVTTYPTILTFKKERSERPYSTQFLIVRQGLDNLGSQVEQSSFDYPSDRLNRNQWHFEPEPLWRLRDRIESASTTRLADVSATVSGVKTGLTRAFVIDGARRKELVSIHPRTDELIRPWTTGDDIARWSPADSERYLIFVPKGWTKQAFGDSDEPSAWAKFQTAYPAVSNWLLLFESKARTRTDKGDYWWELRACDYYELFDERTVIFPEMSQGPKFAIKGPGSVSNNKTFLLPHTNDALLAFLNSRLCWFLLHGICTALRGGVWRLELRADYLRELPLPDFGNEAARLADLANHCYARAEENDRRKEDARRRIVDLAPQERRPKLTPRLERWWELDFQQFRAEVKRAFRADIPLKERGEWESWLAENAAEIRRLTTEIEAAEREIDAIVYRLFDLTADEIALLESSLAGQA